MDDDFDLFVGIDWGSESHQVCALDGRGGVLREWSVEHGGAELVALAEQLLELAKGRRVAVAIEVPRGAIVETLLEREIAVFSVNPRQLDRFRDRHTVAGAKDDRRDARVLADSVRTDQKSFRRVKVGEPQLVQLRELSRMYEEVRGERVMLANRLREQLHRYFPALLRLGSVVDTGYGDCLSGPLRRYLQRNLAWRKCGQFLSNTTSRSGAPKRSASCFARSQCTWLPA